MTPLTPAILDELSRHVEGEGSTMFAKATLRELLAAARELEAAKAEIESRIGVFNADQSKLSTIIALVTESLGTVAEPVTSVHAVTQLARKHDALARENVALREELERFRYASAPQAVAWKERALKAEEELAAMEAVDEHVLAIEYELECYMRSVGNKDAATEDLKNLRAARALRAQRKDG